MQAVEMASSAGDEWNSRAGILMKCGSAYAEVTKHTDPLTSAAFPPGVINSRLHMKIPGKQGKLMLLKSVILDKSNGT